MCEVCAEIGVGWLHDKVADLQSQIETLTASLRAIQEERDTLKAIVENPSKWMIWCDSRVLERAEAAEATLAQLAAGGRSEGRATWQPIESAPRDGTRVLARISTGPSPRIIQFQATFGWLDDASYWPSVTDIQGWMPLPSASGEDQ